MIEPVESRFDGTSATLAKLKLFKALMRGMDLTKATETHTTFFASKWSYGCFFTQCQR